jgi:radical SAM protein with 4Fe4S-binding SPASM domain
VVWELTMACNMRCRHCGSSCTTGLPDELGHEEALDVCDQLAELGTGLVTLSGGEPLLRADWHRLAARLVEGGVTTNILSNGWLIDDDALDKAEEAGLASICVSLDGMQATHDFIRCRGSFGRVTRSLDRIRARGIETTVVTTLMRRNLPDLERLKEHLVDLEVGRWQLQIGSPMGNMAEHIEDVIEPEEIPSILEFARVTHSEGGIRVILTDCLGYYTATSRALREAVGGVDAMWNGCPAGRFALGVRHNGEVCGCNSVRGEQYIEGNIRETTLDELWNRPGAFEWNRGRTRASLSGFCRSCQFGDICLAGCSSLRLSMPGPDGEYRHCAHRIAMEGLFPKLDAIRSLEKLEARADKAIELDLFDVADRCLRRALEMAPDDADLMKRAGLTAYFTGDWERCRILNQQVLETRPNDAYALKGLGLALAALGNAEDGIATLRRSLRFCGPQFMDPYHDLAVVLCGEGRPDEALSVLDEGRAISEQFRGDTEELREFIRSMIVEPAAAVQPPAIRGT